MGDIVAVKIKEERGLSSIFCFMLNIMNYTVWVMRMKFFFKVYKVWEVVENELDVVDKNDMVTAFLF